MWSGTFQLAVRRRVAVAVTLGLLLAVALAFLTGFVAAALDLNRFVYHKYAAYAAVALALVHIVLHWRSLSGQVRRWLLNRTASQPAALSAHGPRMSRRRLLLPGLTFVAGAGLGHVGTSRASPLAALGEGDDLGQIYHRWSTPTYTGLLVKSISVASQPPLYKEFPGTRVAPLPKPTAPSGMPLELAIARRRSVREYADRQLTLAELGRLLYYVAGITDERDPTLAFRAVPSSGALFPIEVYPVVFEVDDLQPGVYHYAIQPHGLELLRAGDFRQDVFHAAVSQEMLLHASVAVVLTGIFSRVQFKYVDRSYRYVMLEAGHVGQNLYLEATGIGLAPCGIGAFLDDELNRLLGVDGKDEATVYLLAVGPRSESSRTNEVATSAVTWRRSPSDVAAQRT
jgi:SagB-type dehydrogenase family enzyme